MNLRHRRRRDQLRDARLPTPVAAPGRVSLSSRETEMVKLLLCASSNAEIARALGLANTSIETYLSRLYSRVGVKGRLELALRAERENWITS